MRKFSMILAVLFTMGIAAPAVAQDEEMGTELFTVDLETGEFMSVGSVGDGDILTGFALNILEEEVGPAVATTSENELIWFDVDSPETIDERVELTNIDENTMIVGIDYRPETGELVALGADSILYVIDEESGEANPLAEGAMAVDPAIEDTALGFDFNPTVDRIRVDVSTTQNLRLNPETGGVGEDADTGEPTIDGDLAYAEGDVNEGMTPRVVGAGYTNSVPDAEETELYVLDAETQSLALQDPPNDGVLNTIGETGTDLTDWTGFDIHPMGDAYATVSYMDEMPEMATPIDMDDDMATPDDEMDVDDDDAMDMDDDMDATPVT